MEIYLDNSATTRVFPEVAELMAKVMCEDYGNPSSLHMKGVQAEQYLRSARETFAGILKVNEKEIFFTSGGTESDNMALIGCARAGVRQGKHLITTQIEHPAVLNTMRYLESQGFRVTYLPVDAWGRISLEDLRRAMTPETVLVSVMHTNNEVGSLQPVAEAASLVKRMNPRTLFHVDAVQGFGKAKIYPRRMGIDLLSVSGHKIHAPKGIGALYIREGVNLPPLIRGRGQESGLRSGTEATAQIAAFAAAARLGAAAMDVDTAHMSSLKAYTVDRLAQELPEAVVLVPEGAPHILPISLPACKSEVIVRVLSDHGIYISSGSACHKGTLSHVFAALKLPKPQLDGALRISFSYDSTRADVDALIQGLKAAQNTYFPTLS